MKYAYLHGFASSSKSEKGRELAARFADRGVELKLPELNEPSFAELTYTGMIRALDEFVAEHGADEPWRFVGSSMGGYIAARWSEQNPGRVDRMLLLCPGFDFPARWREILGDEGLEEWKRDGDFLFMDPEGKLEAVHWELYEDAVESHPSYPDTDVPIRIIHGERDSIVELTTSRNFVDEHEDAEVVMVDDDHKLYDSVDRITEEAFDFFDID
ncbi:MAG: YqiA/YcfP family alpha/beta fold hydrolase [Bradymonadaceae bacterium]